MSFLQTANIFKAILKPKKMKNRIGKPEFIVRLNDNEEKVIIKLAKQFSKDSYAKTLVAVSLQYDHLEASSESAIKRLMDEKKELLTKLNASEKLNKSLSSKMDKFVRLVDKIADIKIELKIFRPASTRTKK